MTWTSQNNTERKLSDILYLAWNRNFKVTHSKPQEGLAISTELFLITTPCTAKTSPLSSGLLKAPTIALEIKPATLCFADQYSAFAHHLTLCQPWGSFQLVLTFALRYYHYPPLSLLEILISSTLREGGELNRGEAYLRGGLLDLVACKQALQLGDGSLRSTYKMDSLLADYKFSKHDGINSPWRTRTQGAKV